MNNDNFVKVFDVVDSRFWGWGFSAFGLIFVIVGTAIVFFPRILKALGIPNLNFNQGSWIKSRLERFLGYSFIVFGILWTALTFSMLWSTHVHHETLSRQNLCRTVEGPVERFVPAPYTGRGQESFSVAGVQFKYSDSVITDGFNNTSSHGGPIRSDSYVRICYDPAGNVILRLEIRDFKGEAKDHVRELGFFPFPQPGDTHQTNMTIPGIYLPWYGDLFVVLSALDWLGIYALYLPYLRTFFRLTTMTVRDCAIPASIERDKKIKLRNSLIYWDTETCTIWLRPRGWNLVKVPWIVGGLKTDVMGRSITATEIRLSSGAPLVVIAFFTTAYVMFSSVMPSGPGGLSPGLFVGAAALMFVVMGIINIRMLRSPMQQLIDDAMLEIRQTHG